MTTRYFTGSGLMALLIVLAALWSPVAVSAATGSPPDIAEDARQTNIASLEASSSVASTAPRKKKDLTVFWSLGVLINLIALGFLLRWAVRQWRLGGGADE